MLFVRPIFLTVWIFFSFLSTPARAEELLRTERPPGRPGGRLVVALGGEPQTWNPVLAKDAATLAVLRRMNSDLVHIDRVTQETVPALAKRWSTSANGSRLEIELRRGIRFSDGHPLDADDVTFSFEVYQNEEFASPQRSLLVVGGEPVRVEKLDSHTLRFVLKEPYAVGDRLFDSVAILPRHRLEKAYRAGKFEGVWSISASPRDIVGLGPFRLKSFTPGERLELERNPYYWKRDQNGHRLPYLDSLTFLFVPDQNAAVLRFQAGEVHLIDHLEARDYNRLARLPRKNYILQDLGAGLIFDFLVFNLNDLENRNLPEIERKQRWFQNLDFRRAISFMIDRKAIARLIYQGRATPLATHVTPGYKSWLHPDLAPTPRSIEKARELLAAAGFKKSTEGRRLDPDGVPVRFSTIVASSNTRRREIAALIQNDVKALGIELQIVPVALGTLVDRLTVSYEYDSALLALNGGDADPNSVLNVLSVDGSHHLWRLGAGDSAPEWEKEVDRRMQEQLSELDRDRRAQIYFEVQELLAENLPFIYLVSPNVLVGASSHLGNFAPAILDHSTLWNADELYFRQPPRR